MRNLLFLLVIGLTATLTSVSSQAVTPADFAADATYWSARISPTGEYLAVGLQTNGKRSIAILDTSKFQPIGAVKFPDGSDVGQFRWANDERLVINIVERLPWQEEWTYLGELFAVDYDGGNGEYIFGYRASGMQTGTRLKQKTSTKSWADVINLLEEDDEHILISSTPITRDGASVAKVHKLNIYTGQLGPRLKGAPVPYAQFIASDQGDVKVVTGINADSQKEVHVMDEQTGDWRQLDVSSLGHDVTPLALDSTNTRLYLLGDLTSDKIGMHELNLNTGDISEVYTDEVVDVTTAAFTSDESAVFAVRVDPGYPEYVMIDDSGQEAQIFRDLVASFPGYDVSITSHSDDGRLWVVYVSSDVDLGSFYLYDKQKNGLTFLFKNFGHIKASQLAASEPVSFEARDGTTLYGYLTYPVQADKNTPVPLVTLVHGGPRSRDYWSFDREVQLLANEGYAVLRVNFRGSAGYGMQHMHAGDQQWGARVQHDIIDGTRWAASQPGINARKVCIMGTSFGGYSALQAPLVDTSLFRCAVANAGPYDLQLMFEEGDVPTSLYGESMLQELLGTNQEQLRTFSPVHNLEKLNVPVLIAHGEKDVRVPVEHAEAVKAQLDKLDKPYEWFVEDRETHGFHNAENRARYYQKVTAFLAEHLQ